MLAFSASELALAALMLVGAALYSSVGHAGASAYLALMALFGVPPGVMRPTALVLNLIVAGFASVRFVRAGLFRWRTLWPFLLGSLPFAYLGGTIDLPSSVYRPAVGAVLLVAAARLFWPGRWHERQTTRDPPVVLALAAGAAIGLLSGLTGTGGGIFLSPLILFLGWSAPRPASGVAALFILANSAAGLAGNLASVHVLPAELPLFAGAVLIGAALGTSMGIRLQQLALVKLLGAVLVVAGAKLIGLY